jgi:hypothetical protein
VAWQLEAARAGRMVALFSDAYFERSRYTTEEWTAALGRLVPGPGGGRAACEDARGAAAAGVL